MLRRRLLEASSWRSRPVCLFCAARSQLQLPQARSFAATSPLLKRRRLSKPVEPEDDPQDVQAPVVVVRRQPSGPTFKQEAAKKRRDSKGKKATENAEGVKAKGVKAKNENEDPAKDANEAPQSLKDALLGSQQLRKMSKAKRKEQEAQLHIQMMFADDLNFEPVEVDKPAIPMLAYGLDRVLFNPGVYRLQDPRSRIYNFDPYLEKIMPVKEFDFDALSEYKTSSKDQDLLNLTKRLGTKFTGSTSSMSSILQHFHYLLSNHRELNHSMLSRVFPDPSKRFSKITLGPDAVFLRYNQGIYAIDADKTYDKPNVMSWLGHSLEKLLTVERNDFELYRRSSSEKAPPEGNASRCYHYSKLGNVLMRSQLDAHDPRLPGTGVFDLKTRAVVSIRMNHKEYEAGSGYQLRFAQGEWESFEREFYDMTRATMLKYSLQVRMGRMDGIFLAYHNIERIFGFQYLSLGDMDAVLHGQSDTTLGDQEFKLSIGLVDELLSKAIEQYPETSLRLHFETREAKTPFMYIFAEPVTEEQADEIQNTGNDAQREFARNVVGIGKDNPDVQAAWQDIQGEVDEQVGEDGETRPAIDIEETGSEQQAVAINATENANEEAEVPDRPTQDVTSEVDEQVGEDGVARPTTTSEATGSMQQDAAINATEDTSKEAEAPVSLTTISEETSSEQQDAAVDATENTSEGSEAPEFMAKDVTSNTKSTGPLMGWTLTVRSKVNGGYVDRPVQHSKDDDWKIEYHIQEIPPESRWRLYNALKERRRGLIGMEEREVDKGLQHYRDQIQRFSNRGREWRKKQDELNEELGVQLYKPMGPGSETTISDAASPVLEDDVPDLPKPPAGEEAMKDLPEPPAVEDMEKLPPVPS